LDIYKRLWQFSNILLSITALWGIWIFGFVWRYYGATISLLEGSILLILSAVAILTREVVLADIRKQVEKTKQATLLEIKKYVGKEASPK